MNYKIYKSSFSQAADGMITFKGPGIEKGSTGIPILKEMPDWKTITIQISITAKTYKLEGQTSATTGVKFTVKTSADPDAVLTSSSKSAVLHDASTSFETNNQTDTGESNIIVCTRQGTSNKVSNVGAVVGVLCDLTSLGSVTGSMVITVSN